MSDLYSRLRDFVALMSLLLLWAVAPPAHSHAQDNPDFELAPNGVTVLCDDAEVGDTGEVDGTVYTKRNRDQITIDNAATTCTSGITDMSELFRDESSFIEDISTWDISTWDVSGVTDMGGMFREALSFNQDISEWDVSSVTNMRNMFRKANSFNQDLGEWDVSSVEDMRAMFRGAESFNQDISGWDVSSVTDMRGMFLGSTSFNQDISGWDVSSVTDMSGMFYSAESFNQDIGDWDVSSVESMRGMFGTYRRGRASSFNQDISGWDVSSVTDMSLAFAGAESFNQDIGGWDVSNVTDMNRMFDNSGLSTTNYDALLIEWAQLDLNEGVTLGAESIPYSPDAEAARQSLIDDFGWMINDARFVSSGFELAPNGVTVLCDDADVGDGGEVDGTVYTKRTRDQITTANAATTCTSGIMDMGSMFGRAELFNQDISTWDVSSVTDMSGMFVQAFNFNADISNWDVSSVESMSGMFAYAVSFNQDIGGWDVSGVTDMGGMFREARSFNQDIGEWDVSSVTNMGGMFAKATSFNQDISGWDVSGVGTFRLVFGFTGELFSGFLQNAGLSSSNYDALLNGWATLNLQNDLTLDAQGIRYSMNAEDARQSLIDDFRWTINDAGLAEE